MKLDYKGFEISVKREESLAGYDLLYLYIMDKSDGFFVIDSFEDSAETIKEKIKDMKAIVDDYLEYPENYDDSL
jgi:hypothetical protein